MNNKIVKTISSVILLSLLSTTANSKALRSPVQTGDEIIIAKGDIPTPIKYQSIISHYMSYVIAQLDLMIQQLDILQRAINQQQLMDAQAAYISAHQYYEMVRPIIMLFGNTDRVMNSTADYYLQREQDYRFIGFHRVEYFLFDQKNLTLASPAAEELLTKAKDLRKRMATESIEIPKLVQASADFMEMILETKLAGKEQLYSQSDITDIAANIAGSEKIIGLITPFINKDTLTSLTRNYAAINKILDNYRLTNNTYQLYSKLSQHDKMDLFSLISQQAERLAELRAQMDVDVYYKY
ncbi:EfeM/EfeO family lipoprotein [Moellerella wisconsensis]|uniref:EfeM/EfeO family lipoprotein n=1 Tax=Moellerella wisconsensis TaxID=158849 RepID=UPI001F4F0E4C|nr:EfeM/EfeO family lipoprotein [Moellerella wisconsensis]UNH41875.1 EfeM/EfeO family lipoprotein [Moellerella wisconsensis]WJW81344.1 EfeM/EfeO family lipoprotein [Moellerella wisconsensis]